MIGKINWLKSNVWAILLYCVPIVFFVVAYFGITVSGEDIYQGAGNYNNGVEIDIASDAGEAFRHNGRLTDVYAWTVIDFFDYQFRFGLDMVFRLLDVLMASGIFYMMTMLVVGRRPRLTVRDALMFDVSFLMVILTQHGRVFYAGFSAIHNYMIAIFIMLVFSLPYLMSMLDKKVKWMELSVFAVGMFILGVLFGMSAAIPPIAFMIVAVIYIIYKKRKSKEWRVSVWAIFGLVGVLVGIICSNALGPGSEFYTTSELYVSEYDYVPMGELFSNPLRSIVHVVKHIVSNFGRVLLPIAIVSVMILILSKDARKVLGNKDKKNVLVVSSSFMILSILGASQINAPLRILLPAYITGVVMILMLFSPYIKSKAIGIILGVMVVIVVGVKIGLTISYSSKMSVVLNEIKNSEELVMCVEKERISAYNFPVVYLGQENMLADWAMPEEIYGKQIEFCAE